MAYPADFVPGYDYVAFAAGQGDNSFPGAALATDLADIQTSIAAINDFLQVPFRSDAVLKLGSTLDTVDLATATDAAAASAAAALASEGIATASKDTAVASAAAAATTLSGAAVKANNLSDLANIATARTNLGLGTAATTASTAYATAAQGTLAGTALQSLPTGSVVKVVNSQTGAVATGTTIIPRDDTIPQSTEGDQYLSVAITPASATNILDITVVLHASCSVTTDIVAALFRDATAGALAVASMYATTSVGVVAVVLRHQVVAGSTAATTFKVRAGPITAGTVTFNGSVGGRYYGGVYASSIKITEVKA